MKRNVHYIVALLVFSICGCRVRTPTVVAIAESITPVKLNDRSEDESKQLTPSMVATSITTPIPTYADDDNARIYDFYYHSRTENGMIMWGFRYDDFATICFQARPDENPYWQENGWIPFLDDNQILRFAVAGAYRLEDQRDQGALLIFVPRGDPCVPEVYLVPNEEGPIEIVNEQDYVLLLKPIDNERLFRFDLKRDRFFDGLEELLPSPTQHITPDINTQIGD